MKLLIIDIIGDISSQYPAHGRECPQLPLLQNIRFVKVSSGGSYATLVSALKIVQGIEKSFFFSPGVDPRLSTPLCCIHFRAKRLFIGRCHLPKLWDKKPKATTKVTLARHQNIYNFSEKFCSAINALRWKFQKMIISCRFRRDECLNDLF